MAQEKNLAFKFLKEVQQTLEWTERVIGANFHFDKHKFISFLEDGTSLCSLAIYIDERCIPRNKMYAVPRNMHQKRDNVFLFLEACKDFGVPTSKLFKDTDLLERKNLLKVVRCIDALEEIAVTKHNFSIRMERLSDEEVAFTPEELSEAETMLHIKKPVIVAKKPTGSSVNIKQFLLELQARGFKVDKFTKTITYGQRRFRGKKIRIFTKQRNRAIAFRENIAKEIFSTEETYVKGLQNLVNNFKVPLQKEVGTKKEYINNEEIKTIFSDVEIILGYNAKLLDELRPVIKEWSKEPEESRIGHIFLTTTKYLKVYTSYVKNYDDALTVLGNCRKEKEKFAKFLRKMEEDGQNIEMLLILPIQRIPRYNLLLEQLVKHTWAEHPDKAPLEEAYNTMKDVAAYVNEKKREFESIAKVREIQNAFVGKQETLISPNRKFIRSDIVYLWANNIEAEKKPEQLMVTLFNDLIVVSTPNKKGTLKFKEAIRIGNVRIKEPKLRKWATKRATLTSSPDKRERSDSVSSEPGNMRGSLSGSLSASLSGSVDGNKGGTLGGSTKRDNALSSRNTMELINSKDEAILKVVFENPVSLANWSADFKKTKEELDQIDAQKTERAKKLSEATKHSITSNFLKSMEEKRANMKTSSLDPEKQQQNKP